MITFNEHYVMDKNGNHVGVFLDIADYRKILEKLEELESIHASDTVKASRGEVIPSEQADDETEAEAQDWRALCGKYRDVLTPTEQFFREKQEEIGHVSETVYISANRQEGKKGRREEGKEEPLLPSFPSFSAGLSLSKPRNQT